MIYIVIALSCGLGAIIRYFFTYLNRDHLLPYGTLFINLSAAFLMGYLTKYFENQVWYPAVSVGFLGGLGTYSTLNDELVRLHRHPKTLLLYFFLTYLGGFLAMILGFYI